MLYKLASKYHDLFHTTVSQMVTQCESQRLALYEKRNLISLQLVVLDLIRNSHDKGLVCLKRFGV